VITIKDSQVTIPGLEQHFVSLENFGHSLRAPAYLLKPARAEEIAEAFQLARRTGLSLNARGAGRSYKQIGGQQSGCEACER